MQVEFIGNFYNNHSLSIVNRNIAIELDKLDVSLRIIPLDSYDPEYKVDKEHIKVLKKLEKVEFSSPASIQLRHTYPPIWHWPEHSETKVVFIQPWEYPKAPFEWQYKFETFADALIVPSNYCKTIFTNGGINPAKVFVVPNGYNEAVFNTDDRDKLVSNKFRFTFVGNHQWRKGLDILLQAWVKSFVKADKVELVIKDNPKIYGQSNILSEIIKLQYKHGCADIRYINDDLSELDIANLYKSSQAIVHPYRAEGFAMHIQEAVACGCVPIVSANGPTDDFISDSAGIKIPVQPKIVNITDPGIFAMKPGDSSTMMSTHTFINEPSVEYLIRAMQYLYHSHDREAIIKAMINTKELNTWSSVAKKYMDALLQVCTQPIKR